MRKAITSRRGFLAAIPGLPFVACAHGRIFAPPATGTIMTVNGPIPTGDLGLCLTHEHIAVDFSGAARWKPETLQVDRMFKQALPHLRALRARGFRSLVECTPAFVGRSARAVQLLARLSRASGLHILTNTGFYGAVSNRYLPAAAVNATPEVLADLWTNEIVRGIDDTGIFPGFLKIGTDAGPLSPIHKRLVTAAGLASKRSGLPIAIHTGDGRAAQEQRDTLDSVGVPTFIWVHAQNDSGPVQIELARKGVFISLDGFSPPRLATYVDALTRLAERDLLAQVLLSHDDGWALSSDGSMTLFGNGNASPFCSLFTTLWPQLEKRGFGPSAFAQLFSLNPARAFSIAPTVRSSR